MSNEVKPIRENRIQIATDMYTITPSDTTDLSQWSVITTDSTDAVKVKVTTGDGTNVVILLRGGVPSLCAVKRVWATGGDDLSSVTILGVPYL